MFRPSRWFGWNRPNSPSNSSPARSNGGGGHGTSGAISSNSGQPPPAIANVENPHSLEHLRKLHDYTTENKVVTEENRNVLVETVRQMSEILIWGDQNDATVFDFFLEKNMLYVFLQIMKQPGGGNVCTQQLLQTLNILFENIRHETSLYYLLSNNHINKIIEHRFDFDDEEVMAYYISFLKTLSLKLNVHTIHFFFNEATADFPLYTEAIKFFNHPEKMVRIAVRTLTLNVFRVREKAMLAFIRDCTAAPYFGNLTWFIGKHVTEIEGSLQSYIANRFSNNSGNPYSGQNHLIRLEDLIAEHLDHLHYLNDILLLNIDDLNVVLADNLLHRLIIPLYLHSFLSCLYSNGDSKGNQSDTSKSDKSKPQLSSSDPGALASQLTASLSPTVALFLLTQAYLIFSYEPLLGRLVNFLLRSTRADIELNVAQCEFAPPEETLEQALVTAKSTVTGITANQHHQSTSSSADDDNKTGVDESEEPMDVQQSNAPVIFPAAALPVEPNLKPKRSDFKPSFFANAGPAKPLPPPTLPSAVSSASLSFSATSSPSHLTSIFPSHSSSVASSTVSLANPATAAEVPMEVVEQSTKSPEVPPMMTIRNWPEYPFLIAFLSTLNSSISSNNNSGSNLTAMSASVTSASLANVLSHPSSRSNSIPTISAALTPTNSNATAVDRGSTVMALANSCHSPTVSRSIVELSSADDRLILFTLSMIASILANKKIDLANYCGVFVPPSADASPSDSEATNSYCSALLNSLLLIMRHCTSSNSSIRIVTFELAVYLFRRIIFYYHHHQNNNSNLLHSSTELTESTSMPNVVAASAVNDNSLKQGGLPASPSLQQYHQQPQSTSVVFLSDHQLAVLEQANEDAAHLLRQLFRSADESVFLELFEQEATIAATANAASENGSNSRSMSESSNGSGKQRNSSKSHQIWSHSPTLSLEQLFMDSTLLLPPDEIAPSSFDSNFYLRLPMNEYERTRYAIKVFFILRRLSADVRRANSNGNGNGGSVIEATEESNNLLLGLPPEIDSLKTLLESTETTKIALDQFLDLENCDLNSCSIRFFYPLSPTRGGSANSGRNAFGHRGNHQGFSSAPGSCTDSPYISGNLLGGNSNRKLSRFMTITTEHLLLLEPDTKHYGWGIIRFVARLQDLTFWSHAHAIGQLCAPANPKKERDDVQSIYVHFRRYQMSSSMMEGAAGGGSSTSIRSPTTYNSSSNQPLLIRFTFDDQIRCYAAKQHLTKAQSKVHDRKMTAIIRLIDYETNSRAVAAAAAAAASSTASATPISANDHKPDGLSAAIANSKDDAAARKKALLGGMHPLLSRSMALPGGAVSLSNSVVTATEINSCSNSSAKFEMLHRATKYAYPTTVGSAKTSSTSSSSRPKSSSAALKASINAADDAGEMTSAGVKAPLRKKKVIKIGGSSSGTSGGTAGTVSNLLSATAVDEKRNPTLIPLNDLSPQTVRRGSIESGGGNVNLDNSNFSEGHHPLASDSLNASHPSTTTTTFTTAPSSSSNSSNHHRKYKHTETFDI